MQIRVIRPRNTPLIGEFAPVAALSLLRPYPPNAGSDMKHPPITLATPRATSSRLALKDIPFIPPLFPSPRPFAAIDDSKNPSSAMMKDVLIALGRCRMCDILYGQRKAKVGFPSFLREPRTSNPFLSHWSFQVRITERKTTRNRSGKKTIEGKRGSRRLFRVLRRGHQHIFLAS